MAEIIDVLVFKSAENPQFTVDTASATGYVTTTPNSLTDYALYNADGHSKFRRGDSFRILSAGYVIPEAFQLFKASALTYPFSYTPTLIVSLRGITSSLYYTIDVLSGTSLSAINIPMDNFELSMDVFVNTTLQTQLLAPAVYLDEPFVFRMGTIPQRISMLNVPAAYNTKIFFITPFIKILHNHQLYT